MVKVVEYHGPTDTPEFKTELATDIIVYANQWIDKGYAPSMIAAGVARGAAFVTAWALTFNNDAVLTTAQLDTVCKAFRDNIIKYVAQNAPEKRGRC